MQEADTETQIGDRSAKRIMKAIIISATVIFIIILVIVATVTALAVFRHKQYIEENKNSEIVLDEREIEARWARKNKVCVGKPPGMPRICMSWDWNERDYNVGTVVNYYCRKDFAVPESKSKIIRRVECNKKNQWVIVDDKIETCVCPEERQPR